MPNMPSLAERQAAFGQALRLGADATFLAGFVEREGIAGARFAAYRRNVLGNLHAALAATYPVLSALIGPARFEALCDAHVAAHRSCDGDLNAYGADLPEIVSASDAATEHPWLPDVARLEWALQIAYAAADPMPLALDRLLAVPPERQADVSLTLWPGASLLASRWPVGAIWRAHGLDPSARDAALAAIDLAPGAYAVLTTRDLRGSAEVVDFSPGQAALWRACSDGLSLGAALEAALAAESGLPIVDVLPHWFARRLIVDIQ